MRKLYTILIALLLTTTLWAQTPEKMSYQAVIRNSSDALVSNQAVGMQISILQGSETGTAVYVETQTPTTNANGLVSIEIGTGTTSDDYSSIDWANGTYFIKTEIDPSGGASYTITGTSQLLSVPYALYSKTSGSSIAGPQGEQGKTGAAGADGTDGTDGTNGIDGVNGTNGTDGTEGASAYSVAVTNGFSGTETEWLASLNGADGAQGIQGETGAAGADGTDGTNGIDGVNGTNGTDGIEGASAYSVAVTNGFSGTEAEWLASLNGTDGAQGIQGFQGIQGIQGETGAAGFTTTVNGVTQVAGAITLTKANIGLANVDNTSDANKPVSTATQTALNLKVDKDGTKVLSTNDFTDADKSNLDANTAKTGITAQQTSDITANNAKVGVAPGTQIGEMQYWNGTAWVVVATTANEGATLQMISGVPTWVGGTPPPPPPAIGANFEGGIVVYVLQPDDPGYDARVYHGLIASYQIADILWCNGTNTTTGATATAIGTGNANTNAIVASQGPGNYAAQLCADLSLGGYDDWYLPSKDELNKILLNKGVAGGPASYRYWSSTEDDLGNAWTQKYSSQRSFRKSGSSGVYAIRAF
ncbi:MAG: DUF1566 domain-containing protein [Bacteroidetes bacterium]|nr:DUF1566 domain-containing protein [Bacteroidota bacterium]